MKLLPESINIIRVFFFRLQLCV